MTTNALAAPLRAALQSLVSELRDDADSLTYYGRDWSRLNAPAPSAVVFPSSADEVVALVKLANREKLALVPSGGRTGMSAAATATAGELIVSFERMNRVLSFDPIGGSAVCEPGVITEQLQRYADERGWFYPVDFGSRGSSQLGGNIATNAGGIKVIRYGMTRNWVTGLKVVTGAGDLLDLNRGLIKNATGYDLRHLFIGSEGTLGLIVEATVQFTRQPERPRVLLLAVPTLDAIMTLFGAFARRLTLNAFECFTDKCLHRVLAKGLQPPFGDESHPYFVLLEFDCASDAPLETALAVFEDCMEKGWAVDGVVSESDAQARELWRLREEITEAIADKMPYKNDVSVPVAAVADFTTALDALLSKHYPDFEVLYFGHVGDGNLHVNILKPDGLEHGEFVQRCEQVNVLLFETVRRFQGSISAEHGVGLTKKPYLHYSRAPAEVDYMRSLKRVFDPNGVMNPGKIFDL